MNLRKRKIALLFNMRAAIQRQVLHGIARFAMSVPHWHWRGTLPVTGARRELLAWRPDGVIGSIENEGLVELVGQMGVPAVDISNCLQNPSCLRVGMDDEKIGRLAAAYFIERGFTTFAYVGGKALWFSEMRRQAYVAALAVEGYACEEIVIVDKEKSRHPSTFWVTDNERLKEWLLHLRKPVAVFAACDLFALTVLSCCQQAGITVPGSVAVLGVDNDETLCSLARPPLSSISQPAEGIGFAAATLLDMAIKAQVPSPTCRLFNPGPVITRASTDILSIPDQDVCDAVRFIRHNVGRSINIVQVVEAVAISRRRLEQKFQKTLGHTPQEEIRRARVDVAKRLLMQTDMAMPAIAARAGFANATRMGILFRRYIGTTPRNFRRDMAGC
jgi:LacI family transcriptional regulator